MVVVYSGMCWLWYKTEHVSLLLSYDHAHGQRSLIRCSDCGGGRLLPDIHANANVTGCVSGEPLAKER